MKSATVEAHRSDNYVFTREYALLKFSYTCRSVMTLAVMPGHAEWRLGLSALGESAVQIRVSSRPMEPHAGAPVDSVT